MLDTLWQTNLFGDSSEVVTVLVNERGIYAGNRGQVARLHRDGSVVAKNGLPGLSHDEVRLTAPSDCSLLVVGLHGHVVGLSPDTLEELWRTDALQSSYGEHVTVFWAAGSIYAGCHGHIYRLDPYGAIEAHVDLGLGNNETRFAMTAWDTTLIAGINGFVFGLDRESLKEKWRNEMIAAGRSVVSVVGGAGVVYAGCRGMVYMMDESTGQTKHKNPLPGDDSNQVRLALDANKSRLYVGTNGYGIALTSSSLETVYDMSLPGSGWNITDVAFSNGVVFFASTGHVYALDYAGYVKEKNSLVHRGWGETRLAVDDGMRLVAGLRGYVIGLDIDSSDDMHVGVTAKL